MEDAREVEKLAAGQETEGDKSLTVDTNVINKSTIFPLQKSYKWWIKVIIFSLFVLAGQTVATLLGRLYYDKGGKSKWMGALVQPGGFLVLLPCYLIFAPENTSPNNIVHEKSLSFQVLASSYISVGALLAVDSMMYSIGYKYLPVSTYSLLSATQLAFNAFFSFFINSLKLTPYIVNSLFLLTISSIVLVFQVDDSTHESTYQVSKGQYAIGFICTIGASASAGHYRRLSRALSPDFHIYIYIYIYIYIILVSIYRNVSYYTFRYILQNIILLSFTVSLSITL
ncbi:hypothetical protein ACOSQ3_011866 [Xanthoceras sorbifolium]